MPHVVCLLDVQDDRFTFTWSEGPASFEPYCLEGQACVALRELAAELREKLSNVVKSYLYSPETVAEDSFSLARTGNDLYKQIFNPGADQRSRAKDIRTWLEALRDRKLVETIEVVVDGAWSMPWNALYDEKPDKARYLEAGEGKTHWKPFWGVQYNLTGGKRVDPRYRNPRIVDPSVLMVVDEPIQAGLPDDQQKRIDDFVSSRGLNIVRNKDALRDAIDEQRPDIIYWLSHAEPAALVLDSETVTPSELYRWLTDDEEDDGFGGIAFLNGCQTAERSSDSFVDAFNEVGFSGIVGTEHQTIDTFASPFGMDFLESFLDKGEPIGKILHRLRKKVPLGLLYGAYCPPEIHVGEATDADESGIESSDIDPVRHVLGNPLAATATRQTLVPLPDVPYPSLAYYTREDRALFAARDEDVVRFASLLDRQECRILILHGESGVGKSSFLRAGVIPFLEDECHGYRFLSAEEKSSATESASDDGVVFIRATNDLAGQLSKAILDFCEQPYQLETPNGQTEISLLPRLVDVVGGTLTQPDLRAALLSDPTLLGKILKRLSEPLPFTLLVIVDQCEEVFTLAHKPEDEESTRLALGMLRRTQSVQGDFKLILALRTEYHGRLTDHLRRGMKSGKGVSDYLLTDFDVNQLVDAIRRPTQTSPTPYSSEIPRDKYRFSYEIGLPQKIAKRVVEHSSERRDSVLPLLQVICSQLYTRAKHREEKTITSDDLAAIGGVEGGLRSHVDGLLAEIYPKFKPKTPAATHGWPSPFERDDPVRRLYTRLFNRQADGRVTTALVAQDRLASEWTGEMPFDQFLASASEVRLLRISTFPVGDGEERRVSLGHDSLAKIAAEWQGEIDARSRLKQIVRGTFVASCVALVAAILVGWAMLERSKASAEQVKATKSKGDAEEALQNLQEHQKKSQAYFQSSLSTLGPLIGTIARQMEYYPYVQGIRGDLLLKSREELNKLREIKPDSPKLLAEYATAVLSLGDLRAHSRWDAEQKEHVPVLTEMEARECYEDAADSFDALDLNFMHAVSLNKLGNLEFEQGEMENAASYYERARVILDKQSELTWETREFHAKLMRNESLVAAKVGDAKRARVFIEDALKTQKEVHAELLQDDRIGSAAGSTATLAQMQQWKATLARLRGRHAESLAELNEVVEAYDLLSQADETNPHYRIEANRSRAYRAEVHHLVGNEADTIRDYRDAINSYEEIVQVLPNSRPFVLPYIEAYTNYVRVLYSWHNNDDAWQEIDEPNKAMMDLADARGLAADEKMLWGALKLVQGMIASAKGLKKADRLLQESREVFEELATTNTQPEYKARAAFAQYAHALLARNQDDDISLAIERLELSLATIDQAIAIREEPNDLLQKATVLFELGDAFYCSGDQVRARKCFEESISMETDDLARQIPHLETLPSFHERVALFHCFCLDETLRSPEVAVNAAQQACSLAADHAANSDFVGSVQYQTMLGIALYRAAKYDESAKELAKAFEMNEALAKATQQTDAAGGSIKAVRYKPGLIAFFTAMAESRKKNPDAEKTRFWLDEAQKIRERDHPGSFFMKRINDEALNLIAEQPMPSE